MPSTSGVARVVAWGLLVLLMGPCVTPAVAQGGVVVAGTIGTPETDLTPEQEQHLLGEYWAIAKRYRADPTRATAEMSAWTRDRVGKVQSIQYQPEGARPEYLESRAEWAPATLRAAAMLHSDLALAAFGRRNLMEFEFQFGIADGWFVLADNRQSAPGSLRSRWNVTVARLLLASGELGLAERQLARLNERITGDAAILLVYGTVKEAQASRIGAESAGSRLDEPALAGKPRDGMLRAAAALFEKAIATDPNLVEARLRLARVQLLGHDDARAEPLLVEVLSGQPPPALRYLASMMLGGVRERQGHLAAAAETYLDAILAAPDAQSGYIALAHVMHRMQQPGDAATVLERMFGRPATGQAADPWWTYPLGLDLNIDARFEEYRAEVRR